jgi:hypothetical protein
VNAQPDGPDERPHDDVPPATETWVPPEPPAAGARAAWLPPGARPGEPYDQAQGSYGPPPYGQPYGAPPGWQRQPPPGWQQQQPYGPPPRRPGISRRAKIIVAGAVVLYILIFIGQMVVAYLRVR